MTELTVPVQEIWMSQIMTSEMHRHTMSVKKKYKQAVDKATGEYRKYKTRTLSDVENDYLNSIKMLEQKTDGKK